MPPADADLVILVEEAPDHVGGADVVTQAGSEVPVMAVRTVLLDTGRETHWPDGRGVVTQRVRTGRVDAREEREHGVARRHAVGHHHSQAAVGVRGVLGAHPCAVVAGPHDAVAGARGVAQGDLAELAAEVEERVASVDRVYFVSVVIGMRQLGASPAVGLIDVHPTAGVAGKSYFNVRAGGEARHHFPLGGEAEARLRRGAVDVLHVGIDTVVGEADGPVHMPRYADIQRLRRHRRNRASDGSSQEFSVHRELVPLVEKVPSPWNRIPGALQLPVVSWARR